MSPAELADEKAAAARLEQLREFMHERDHLRDCPNDGRIEAYPETKPARPDKGEPARPVTVIHCIECGGTTVLDEPYEEVLAALDSKPNKEAGSQ
jgi:hypothetical protein